MDKFEDERFEGKCPTCGQPFLLDKVTNGWRSVSVELPEVGEVVDVWRPKIGRATDLTYKGDGLFENKIHCLDCDFITHWQYVSEPDL